MLHTSNLHFLMFSEEIPTCFAKAMIMMKKRKKWKTLDQRSHTHPVTCVFSDENHVIGVPEANGAIVRGADTQVSLSSELAKGETRNHILVARKLTWTLRNEGYHYGPKLFMPTTMTFVRYQHFSGMFYLLPILINTALAKVWNGSLVKWEINILKGCWIILNYHWT